LVLFYNVALAKDISAFLSYAAFMTPDKGPYLETYLSVIGNSVTYKKNGNGRYQGAIEVSLLFKQGEEIKAARKYKLLSPEVDDTLTGKANFIDQQRIPLPAGAYDFEIKIADKNSANKPFIGNQKVNIDLTQEKVCISDIEFLESYKKSTSQNMLTKSGYDLVPYVSAFYPENLNKIAFYSELYNIGKVLPAKQKYVIMYYIESFETGVKMTKFSNFSKQPVDNVNILLAEFPIGELPSGNYNLVLEARDQTNQLLVIKKTFFQRKNLKAKLDTADVKSVNVANSFVSKINSKDTLAEYIRCLRPVSSSAEKTFSENQLQGKDLQLMQQYFLNFWVSRNIGNPEKAWDDYHQHVRYVQEKFGNSKIRGYDTDRGRVYLQYGPPDQRSESGLDPTVHPYEIWQYYKLVNKADHFAETNRLFIFYSPHYLGYDFKLIHSTALGEVQDQDWQQRIQTSGVPNKNPADDTPTPTQDDFGNHVNDLLNNPR